MKHLLVRGRSGIPACVQPVKPQCLELDLGCDDWQTLVLEEIPKSVEFLAQCLE